MTQRSRIFISYSHKDRDRADFLCDELRARDHEVFIDREGIFETEHITDRIRDMIQGADVVLLVLGQNWLTSPACRMELGFALEQNKRILPAAFEDVGADLPPEIKEINYVRFYGDGGDWTDAVERLDDALDRDIDWIRLHTRFGEQAARYLGGEGGPPWGRELQLMRRWIERRPRGAPDPTSDHWRYFKAGMARRKWFQIGSAVVLTLALSLGTVGGLRALASAQCDELRDRARSTDGLDPLVVIENLLPLAGNTYCRASDAWLEVFQVLGETLRRQRLRVTVTLPDPSVPYLDFMPETGQVMTVTRDGIGVLFDPATGAEVQQDLALPPSDAEMRAVYDRGRFLLLQEQRVTVWDPASGEVTGLLFGSGAPVTHAALSPSGSILVVSTEDARLHFHSLASGRALRETLQFDAPVRALSFHPEDPRLLAAVGTEIQVVDLAPVMNGRAPELVHPLPMPGEIAAMSLSGDGNTVAAATGNIVGVWDLTTFEPIFAPDEYYDSRLEIQSIGLSPDGSQLAVGSLDLTDGRPYVRIHDVSGGKPDHDVIMAGHRTPVRTVRYSPDGHAVMTLDRDGVMRLFDVFTGRPVPTISPEMTEAVVSTSQALVDRARGEDGVTLAGTGIEVLLDRRNPRLLRLAHVEENAPPFYNDRLVHAGLVTSMALSPDGRLLVSAADDGEIYVWDAETGLLLYTLGHAGQALVTYVAADFTPSGDFIVSWDNNGDRRVWAIQPLSGDLFQSACRLLPYHDGVRDVAGLGLAPETGGGDPCDAVAVLRHLGATIWLASR